jgi:ribonucleotide reductase beta subunit family protein with ferritin-like domain
MNSHKHWPPYSLVEDSIADRAQQKLDKLERLYHVGQNNIWDGREVLAQLIEKHGKPRLPDDKKESALKVLSVLLWGELAAWAISADLAERIDDVEAKMAATSQAHDEARHFYVLRDYLRALGEPIPRLGGIGRRLLVSILETPSLVHKLIGMQLMVESNALAIFRALGESRIEPVLADLLPYYEKDEARHVGLGVMYLPRLLSKLSRLETAGVVAFQLRAIGTLMSAGLTMHEHFRRLGINPRSMAEYTIKLQDEVTHEMLAASPDGGKRRDNVRGILNPGKGYGPRILDFIHPKNGIANAKPWHRRALRAWTNTAKAVDRALA